MQSNIDTSLNYSVFTVVVVSINRGDSMKIIKPGSITTIIDTLDRFSLLRTWLAIFKTTIIKYGNTAKNQGGV